MARHRDLTEPAAIHPAAFVSNSDPGAVGPHKLWIDTTGGTPPYPIYKRTAADDDWEEIGSASGGVGAGEVGTTELADDAVTFAKMANLATNKVIGRATAGTGDPEAIDLTAAGRALIDDADAAAQRATLGLGSLATASSLAHSATTGQTANDHHNKSHAHDGADGSGTVAHSATTGITPTDHHAAAAAGPDADTTIDSSGAVGTADTFARSGHGHKVATTDAPSGANISIDAAPSAASTGAIARAAHGHRLNTYSSAAAAIGTAAAGTATDPPKRGTHQQPTRPGPPLTPYARGAAATGPPAAGTATDAPSRGSHVHPTGAGTPSTQAFGDAAATGSGPAAAMTDHKHAMPADPTGGAVALSAAQTAATTTGAITALSLTGTSRYRWNGASAATLHGIAGGAAGRIVIVENITAAQVLTIANDSATDGTAGNRILCANAADIQLGPGTSSLFVYDETSSRWRLVERGGYTSAAAAIGTAAAGTAGIPFSRGDHVHATGAGTPSTQAFGDAAATGSGPAAAMTDHKHAMPADPTSAAVVFAGAISPSITADQNDWNPAGLSGASVIRLTTDASRTITGIQGGTAGRLLIIENIGSNDATLANNSASSSAANRIVMPNNGTQVVSSGTSVILLYDGTSSLWRLIGRGLAFAGSSSITTQAFGDSPAAGSVGRMADAGHLHGMPALGTTPSTQAFGDAAAGGSATTPSKNDHKHAMPSAVAAWNASTVMGTSFPGSPATNDRFFRTDRGIEYYYDGTRWLSVKLYTLERVSQVASSLPYAATASNAERHGFPGSMSGSTQCYLVEAMLMFRVASGGTALGASHKWDISVDQTDGSNLTTFSIASGSSTQVRSTTNSLGSVVTGPALWETDFTKTGTPGNLVAFVSITYRLVG